MHLPTAHPHQQITFVQTTASCGLAAVHDRSSPKMPQRRKRECRNSPSFGPFKKLLSVQCWWPTCWKPACLGPGALGPWDHPSLYSGISSRFCLDCGPRPLEGLGMSWVGLLGSFKRKHHPGAGRQGTSRITNLGRRASRSAAAPSSNPAWQVPPAKRCQNGA